MNSVPNYGLKIQFDEFIVHFMLCERETKILVSCSRPLQSVLMTFEHDIYKIFGLTDLRNHTYSVFMA